MEVSELIEIFIVHIRRKERSDQNNEETTVLKLFSTFIQFSVYQTSWE